MGRIGFTMNWNGQKRHMNRVFVMMPNPIAFALVTAEFAEKWFLFVASPKECANYAENKKIYCNFLFFLGFV